MRRFRTMLEKDSLQQLHSAFEQDWFECSPSCRDYHSFYWFYIGLHLANQEDFMTPGNLLRTMQDHVTAALSDCQVPIRALLIGSAAEQSTALVCNILQECFPGRWSLAIIDRCPTPLKRIRAHLGERVQVICSDFGTFQPANQRFDLILGDCILEFNSPENRGKVLENIAALLSSAGTSLIRERTGDVASAIQIARESAYVLGLARAYFSGLGIQISKSDLLLIQSRANKFLLQILDSHNAYESIEQLEGDLTKNLVVIQRLVLDEVSPNLTYCYYLLKKAAPHIFGAA